MALKLKVGKKLTNNTVMVTDARLNIQETNRVAIARSMSNKRLLSTVFALLLGSFLAYSSFFYFPAYQSKPAVIKISTQAGSVPDAREEKGKGLTPYFDHLLMNRGYMKAGQTVSTTYVLTPGLWLDFIVTKCSGPIILEVYSCRGTIVDVVELGRTKSGRIDLTMETSGFYHFTEKVIKSPSENSEFGVVWKRL